MVKRQYLRLDPQRKLYFLGVMTYRLGSAYADRNELEEVARPVMNEIQRLTGEVVNLSVMQDSAVVLVGRINSSFPLRVVPNLGAQTPAYASAAGKAMLAYRDEAALAQMFAERAFERLTRHTLPTLEALQAALVPVRASGVAFDDEESHEGIAAVGTAILGASGEPVGGLSIVLPAPRLVDVAKRERLAGLVWLGGRLISQTQGYLPAIQENHSHEHLSRNWKQAAEADRPVDADGTRAPASHL
jgi:DNA-binding IclR family transcriptional regulator